MSPERLLSAAEQESKREDVRSNLRDLSVVQSMDGSQLITLQFALGFGATWGVIDIPKHYMPAGSFQKQSKRVFDFRDAANNFDPAIAAVTRLAILRWLVPIGQSSRPCTASTLAEDLSTLRRVLRLALSKEAPDSSRIWSRLTQDDLYSIAPPNGKRNFGRIFETLAQRKLLEDVVEIVPRRRLDRLENSRGGLPPPESRHSTSQPYLALPDTFVSECGWRCVWLIKELGPLVVKAIGVALDDNFVDLQVTRHSAMKQFRKRAKQRLKTFSWIDNSGGAVVPPFALHLKSVDERGYQRLGRQLAWPPKSLPDLWRLAWLTQAAHAFVVGLSGGPREGELLSQRKDSLVENSSGWRIRGKTYKLVFRDDGEMRDWPAPEMCVAAVEQQVRLASVAHRAAAVCGYNTEGPQLWILLPTSHYATSGSPMNSLGSSFKGLVRILGLQHLLDDTNLREKTLHPHRLRKTTGRLVGLALTNGLQVLMDLYGHEDPEMTVGYLLSNRDIAEEAKAVAEAQTIMFARDAISEADLLGGPAAARIRSELVDFARLRGINELDAKSIDELARDLTENGKYWELVRPGVLCTKMPGQVGPCNGRQGAPDSAHCRYSCAHRLEMSAERENVDQTIKRIISHLERAIKEDEPMAAEQWRGQLVANVMRFDDLLSKWRSHPLVAKELDRHGARPCDKQA